MTTDELNELQRVCCGFVVADLKAICGHKIGVANFLTGLRYVARRDATFARRRHSLRSLSFQRLGDARSCGLRSVAAAPQLKMYLPPAFSGSGEVLSAGCRHMPWLLP